MSRSRRGSKCGRGCGVCGDEGAVRRQREAEAAAVDERELGDPRAAIQEENALERARARSFWQFVSELAAMRGYIPEERRKMSGVRHVFESPRHECSSCGADFLEAESAATCCPVVDTHFCCYTPCGPECTNTLAIGGEG